MANQPTNEELKALEKPGLFDRIFTKENAKDTAKVVGGGVLGASVLYGVQRYSASKAESVIENLLGDVDFIDLLG